MSENYLAHHGVLGMHWGQRKLNDSKEDKKPLTEDQKQLRKELVGAGVLLGSAVAIRAGGAYLALHPEIFSRTVNTVKGTKAIDIGYDVLKMTLKNGRYIVK